MKRSRLFKLLLTSVLLGVLILPVLAGCTTPDQPDVTPNDDDNHADTPESVAESKQAACGRLDARLAELDEKLTETNARYYCTPMFYRKEISAGKEKINNATTVLEVERIEQETHQNVNSLVLTDEESLQIRQAYAEYLEAEKLADNITAESLLFMLYYGKFNNKYAMVMSDTVEIEQDQIVGGYNFEMLSSAFRIYYEGNFYSLSDAYEGGLISNEELAIVCERNNYFVHG